MIASSLRITSSLEASSAVSNSEALEPALVSAEPPLITTD